MDITLSEFPGVYSVIRLDKDDDIPSWAMESSFYSVTKADDELSILCNQDSVPEDVTAERDWKMLKVMGTLDFSLTGIAAAIHEPLSNAKISVFLISTYDTDYILVKEDHFEEAKRVLSEHFTVDSN